MGATPEMLVLHLINTSRSVAIAGTPASEGMNRREIARHPEIRNRYCRAIHHQLLKKIRLREYEEQGPSTIQGWQRSSPKTD